MPDEPSRQLADFEGVWDLCRDIVQADGTSARFSGRAEWARDGDAMQYCETGQLLMPGQVPMTAVRRYIWQPDLTVWFDDGRFFHQVPGRGGQTQHWCDPDMYKVAYDFTHWPQFQVTWEVSGPRKDYRMVSQYTRGA